MMRTSVQYCSVQRLVRHFCIFPTLVDHLQNESICGGPNQKDAFYQQDINVFLFWLLLRGLYFFLWALMTQFVVLNKILTKKRKKKKPNEAQQRAYKQYCSIEQHDYSGTQNVFIVCWQHIELKMEYKQYMYNE